MTAALDVDFLPADAARELAAAERARAELVQAASAGEAVTAEEVARADAAVRLAELRVPAAERNAAVKAEAERVARIAEVRSTVDNPEVRAKCQRVVELHEQAVAALAEMRSIGDEVAATVSNADAELRELGALPESLVVGQDAGMHDIRRFVSGGVHFPTLNGDQLIVDAANEALSPPPPFGRPAYDPAGPLRALARGMHRTRALVQYRRVGEPDRWTGRNDALPHGAQPVDRQDTN